MNRPPFLVVGCARSGTSLLRAMLDSHPDVFMPPETFFFVSIVPRTRIDPRRDPELAADFIASRWWIREMGIGADQILRAVPAPPRETRSWLDLFHGLLIAAATDAGQPTAVLGEKSPRHVQIAEWYLAARPEGRVVQIVRDPRAVLASFRRVEVGTNSAVLVGREWAGAADVHARLADHPRYAVVRYEDLTADGPGEFARIRDFLGLDDAADGLDFHRRSDPGFSAKQAHHETTLRPLTTSRVDAWSDELDVDSVRLLEHVVGDRMARFGYERVTPDGARPPSALSVAAHAAAGVVHRDVVLRARQLLKRFR